MNNKDTFIIQEIPRIRSYFLGTEDKGQLNSLLIQLFIDKLETIKISYVHTGWHSLSMENTHFICCKHNT